MHSPPFILSLLRKNICFDKYKYGKNYRGKAMGIFFIFKGVMADDDQKKMRQ